MICAHRCSDDIKATHETTKLRRIRFVPLRESILLHLTSRQQKLVAKLIRVMVSDHPGIASFGTQSHLEKQVPYAGELEECGNPAAVGVGAKGQRGRGRSRVVVSHDGDGRKRVLFSGGRSFAKERSLRKGSNIPYVSFECKTRQKW